MATNPTPLSGEPPIPPGFALESPPPALAPPALAQEPPIPPGFRVESPVAPIPSPQNSPEAPSIRAASPTLLQTLREHLFGGPQGETVLGRSFPSLSGARIGDTPTSELPLIRFEDRPPAANAGPVVNAAHGMNQGLDALVGGKNLALMAATGGLGAVGEAAPLLGRAINAGLSTYFGYQMAHGASAAVQAASEAHDAGNDDEAARLLGYGSVQALLAAVSASHAVRSGRGLSDDIADVIDAHNAQAFKLIDADEQHGRGVDLGEHIVGEPQKLFASDGTEYTLQANQASAKGRPNYTVFDSNGKAVYGGIGTDVAEFLRSKGATPPGPDLPAEPPPIVETKATAAEPAMPRGFVAEPPTITVPHESVLTRDAAKVGAALAAPEATAAVPVEPQVAPPPAATPAAPIPPVTPPAEATAPEPAIPAGFHVEPTAIAPVTATPEATAPEPPMPAGFSAEAGAVAPHAEPVAPVASIAPVPSGVRSMDPNDIAADPARFQFKAETGGKAGVGDTLKHLKKFNPDLAGVISVWHDPADGETYVVNGHHRLELAQRTGAPSIDVRYIHAANAQEAYQTGALINIAEGRGTAIDAAKVFRGSQLTPEDLEETHGVSLREKTASDGMALSHLASDVFDQVIQGDLPVSRAVIIGELLRDHQEQRDALKLLDQAEARGKKPTNEQARELIRFVKGAPKVETQAANLSLFGEDTISKNLALEKAEVSDYIKQQLAKTRKLFQATSTLKSADVLGKTGNVIKTEENARVAGQTAKIQAVYDKLSLSAGPIADALDRAAQQLAEGKSPAEVKQHALAEVTESVARTLAALERSAPASSEGSGVEPQSGSRRAGEGESAADGAGSERGSESATVEPPDPPITGRAPRLPAGQAPAFRRGETTKWHMGRMAFGAKPVTLDPFLDRLTIAHVVNASAMEYIGRNIGLANDDAGLQVGGLHLGPLEAAHLLHNAGVDARTIGNPATLQALAQILRDAIKANKSLTLVTDAPHIGEDRREAFLTEELNHVLQRALGPMRQFLKADAARIMALPEAQRALAGLEDTKTGPGYQFNKNDNLAALEISERLMRADRYSYQDLTLSKTERDSLAQEIVRALEQVYGPTRAKDLTGRLRAAIQQSAPHSGIPGRLAREGDDSDLPAHESSRTRIGETGRQRRIAPGDDAERQDSLFGSASDETVAADAARDRDQLQGERLTAQLNAPLTREEQLKKLKRSKDQPQKDLFGENEEPSQGSFTLGSGFGALQPYIDKFIANKVVPTAKQAGEVMALAKDDVLKVLAPAARGVAAAEANLIVRKNASELARSTDRAEAALRVAGKFFDKQTPAQNYAFIDDVENGRPQATPALDAIAATLRTILDQRRAAVQALGKGKLSSFIENYFPHIWEKPAAAREAFMNYAKRPLEGSKSFLKKRSIETIADGLALGLKPLSDNPVELVLLKVREMDKYLMAHHILADLKKQGLLKFVDARDFAPFGWKKIDDAAATVYGPGEIPISEYANKGLQDGMQRVLDTLQIRHTRKMQLQGGALGLSRTGKSAVETKFGTDEQTLAHEIGHQIEDMFPFVRQMMKHPDKKTRIRLKEELRALADLRYETAKPSNYYKQYVRKADEKAAAVVQAYVAARPKFRQVAPLVLSEFEGLINRHPAELGGLRTIQASLEHHPMAGQVDAGGVVVKGHWQAPEPAARIVNNFLSPGLRDRSILFRGFLGAGNLLNQAQLGFSAFHLSFTTIDVAVSKLALGIYQMAHGDVVKGLKSTALVPASPVTNLMRGHQMLKEWNAPGTQSAIIGELVDAAVAAGGRAKMDGFYRTNITKRMMEAFRAHKWFMGAIRVPFAAMEQTARPIMEWIVPRQKMGVFADLAQYEIEKLGTNASDPDVQAALARAWDSVDNRLGQLVYDNLAWAKVVKDLSMVSVRSVGWNLGTIRELAGGVADTGKAAKNAFTKGGPDPELTPRMSYLIALHLLVGLGGAVAYYLAHGHMPHKLKDYYFPTDASGHRWSLPTYIKDEYEWTHDPERTAAGKVHPLVQMLVEMISNKDFFDRQIANPHHSLVKRAEEEAAFVVKQYESLGWRTSTAKGHVVTPEERALGFVGVKPAPKSLDQLGR